MTNQVPMGSANGVSNPTMPTVGLGASNGQPPSLAPVAFTPEQVDFLKTFVEQQTERQNQSIKDRRIAELEKAINELRGNVSTPQTQANQMQVASSANGVTQVAQPAEVDYLTPIKAVGLDANDPDVLKLMMRHGNNPVEFQANLVQLKVARTQAPPASSAAAVPSYNPVPQPVGQDALMLEYQAATRNIKRGPQAAAELANLKIQYRKRGLQIT